MGDNLILILASTACFLSIILNYRYHKRFVIVNLILFAVYSIYLYYGFFNWMSWNDRLSTFMFILLLSAMQFIINIIYLLYRLLTQKRRV